MHLNVDTCSVGRYAGHRNYLEISIQETSV